MATFELTTDTLNSSIAENDFLIIDFWAEWCAPCRGFAPVFEAASEKHSDLAFAKCDTEAQTEVAASFGIRSIPTIAIFREQILLYLEPGALPAASLDMLIEQVQGLDMDEVRRQIAEEEAKGEGDAEGDEVEAAD
ncbi:MAG: thioredoxin domain-containing protein [Myxococcota bacterium]|nr:thioredoxin domain-containing protein [Myxococcota bacterium]